MIYQTISTQRELTQFIDGHRRIFLYGANSLAAGLIVFLMQEDVKISGVIARDGEREKAENDVIRPLALSKTRLFPGDGVILCVEEREAEEIGHELEQRIESGDIAWNRFMRDDFFSRPESDAIRSRERGFFSRYQTLQAIGEQTGTDKATKYHNYCNKYEFFLRDLRDRAFTMIELGVFRGASVRMWREFFPRARIIGVDRDEKCRSSVREDERTALLIRDVCTEGTLAELRACRPTLIVDDASHIWSEQIRALFGLYDSLTDGGIYLLEDLNTSFLPLSVERYADQRTSAYEIVSAIAEEVSGDGRIRLSRNRGLLPYIDGIERIARQTEMVCFMKDCCILIKK